jgi:hypothetical protein
MRKIYGIVAALSGLLLVASAVLAADESYPIKLERVPKAGDVSDVHSTAEQSMAMTMNIPGAPPRVQNQAHKGDLTARETVVAVGADGNLTEVSLAVTRFVDDAGKELIPAGKVAQIKLGEKETTVTIEGGGAIGPDAQAILAALYPPHRPGSADDDAIFGSKTPRKVGESWPLNAKAAAEDFSTGVAKIDAKDIDGQVTLRSVEKTAIGDALRIVADFKGKNIVPPVPTQGLTVNQCEADVKFDGLFPTDTTQPRIEGAMSMDMTMQMASQDGSVTIAMKMHMMQKTSATPVKR